MKAQRMAELFDVSVGDNLNDGPEETIQNKNFDSTRSFESLAADLGNVIQKEMDDTEVIKTAINSTPPPAEEQDDLFTEFEIPGDVAAEVDADIAAFTTPAAEPAIVPEPVVEKIVNPPQPTLTQDQDIPDKTDNKDNPLGLSGNELAAYRKIQKDFPMFSVYDGSVAFRDFYRSKLQFLMRLLTRFPYLDIRENSEELRQIKLDHFVGDDSISPDLLRKKLDDVQRYKTRLTSIMIDALEQFYLWERSLDMLRSKLFKDHTVKPAYNKDGLLLEHVADMECYVGELNGFLEAAKHIDLCLKAAAESLSRQLSCLQFKENVGMFIKGGGQKSPNRFDKFDTVTDGTVISAPKSGSGVSPMSFGKTDDMSVLGA